MDGNRHLRNRSKFVIRYLLQDQRFIIIQHTWTTFNYKGPALQVHIGLHSSSLLSSLYVFFLFAVARRFLTIPTFAGLGILVPVAILVELHVPVGV